VSSSGVRTRQTVNRRQRFPRPRPGAAALDDARLAAALAASPHRPIMLREVLRCLQPGPGDVVVDATLGGGGHAQALLAHAQPGGRLIGLDVDAAALATTAARLAAAGYGPDVLTTRHASFADLPAVVAEAGVGAASAVLVDLGVSTMQIDDASRGLHYKAVGPLDLRFDPTAGEPASALVARLDRAALGHLLRANADEPHADLIAAILTRERPATTNAVERFVRTGLQASMPGMPLAEVKLSVRRTLQALRIAVNDELGALDRLLEALPRCLAPGGRVAILTFHSGEDRRVKQAFRDGHRQGVYTSVAREVVRSRMDETRANRRAAAAKLRWAVRGAAGRAG
jgi:16S rRNA (cytosine1402-N4)-methyltransferase